MRRVIGDVHPSTAELLRIRTELFGADDRRTENVRRGIAELDNARPGAAPSAPC